MGAWQIMIKDLRLIMKDRGALYTLLALPVVFIAILGASTGQLIQTHESAKLLKVAVVDECHSALSKEVFENLSKIGGLKVGLAPNREEAKRYLQDGRSSVLVIIGKDFDSTVEDLDMRDLFNPQHGKLAHGLSAIDVNVQSGAEFVAVSELIEYVVQAAILRVVAPDVAKRNYLIRRSMERMMSDQDEAAGPAQATNPKPVARVGNIIYQTLVPAFMVMFAYFLLNIMASSFITERQLGTLRRLQSSPISPEQLLWGKTLPFLFVSIIQSTLLFLSGKLMFGMSWGTYPFMLVPVILMTSVSATGLGLLLATVVKTESQVNSYATFLIVVLAGISGCYMPRAWLPQFMQDFSLATPHAWALIAYQELLTRQQPNLSIVVKCCAMLAMFGGVAFAVGAFRFRRYEYNR